ncbi:MAG: hypothetical protein NT045_08580 [Candidatus Aureabacteria bacterium]|nr:hypothetical protein [Candidatus Auribacterota bacterium]
MPCRAGAREAVMGEEGDVFPCELMFNRGIGNVREWGYDLPGLMRGDAARQFIAWRRRERCVCTHECNTRTMLLLRPATLARILLRTARGKSACAGEGFC